MFVIRSVESSDLEGVFELSKLANFINLPQNLEMLKTKIESSKISFINPSTDLSKNKYLFILEDTENKKIAGVSMIHAQHGTEAEPHFFLTVGKERKYSESIRQGYIHGTLELGLDTNGPTEVGGLVIHPEYRGKKLGKIISLVRFLYMGIHPKHFKDYVHAELLPPFDADGNSPLWEAIGRRFLNMDYQEADELSRTNKEFILSLFPREKIYETLLPMETRSTIGKVGGGIRPSISSSSVWQTLQADTLIRISLSAGRGSGMSCNTRGCRSFLRSHSWFNTIAFISVTP